MVLEVAEAVAEGDLAEVAAVVVLDSEVLALEPIMEVYLGFLLLSCCFPLLMMMSVDSGQFCGLDDDGEGCVAVVL